MIDVYHRDGYYSDEGKAMGEYDNWEELQELIDTLKSEGQLVVKVIIFTERH